VFDVSRLAADLAFGIAPGCRRRGGLTMSLEGGLEEFEEFFLRRATSAFSAVFSVSNFAIRATSGAIASAMSFLTSVSLNVRSILYVVSTCYAWRKSQARILV